MLTVTDLFCGAGGSELLDELLRCRGSVVISGYASKIYEETLAEWSRVEFRTATSQGGTSQPRTEVIWSNQPISEQLSFFDEEACP